jgi:hypothetical protein
MCKTFGAHDTDRDLPNHAFCVLFVARGSCVSAVAAAGLEILHNSIRSLTAHANKVVEPLADTHKLGKDTAVAFIFVVYIMLESRVSSCSVGTAESLNR